MREQKNKHNDKSNIENIINFSTKDYILLNDDTCAIMQKNYEQNIEEAVMKWYIDHGYNNISHLLNNNISEKEKYNKALILLMNKLYIIIQQKIILIIFIKVLD